MSYLDRHLILHPHYVITNIPWKSTVVTWKTKQMKEDNVLWYHDPTTLEMVRRNRPPEKAEERSQQAFCFLLSVSAHRL